MCGLSGVANFKNLEKTEGFAQIIRMSKIPKVDDPWERNECTCHRVIPQGYSPTSLPRQMSRRD